MSKMTNGLLVGAALCALGMIGTTAPAEARATGGASFSITLGNVVFGYSDGYYDQNRRWHTWRNSQERNWYQSNHRGSFYNLRHDRDNDSNRRNWRNGRSQDWRGGGNH
jgi:hypothetical protein